MSWEKNESGGGQGSLLDLSTLDHTRIWEPLPRGDYPCIGVAEGSKFDAQNSKGNPMVTLVWQLHDDGSGTLQSALQNNGYEGDVNQVGKRKFYAYYVLHMDQGKKSLKRDILAVNPNADLSRLDLDNIGDYIDGFSGMMQLTTRKYEGEDRNNVVKIKPSSVDSFLGR